MYFEQFYLTCLAHASYMIGSQGEAAVIDPQRDVDIYLEAAEEQGLKIRHIFETHLHADFVSGHKELAARTGAKIYIGVQANAGFPHTPLRDGSEVKMGAIRIRTLETPGHTSESICLVVTDTENSAEPWGVLTGDTLFIGDVGRPDLSPQHSPQELAGLLYDSLHQKVLRLPDATLVYPAHGAGSLCGRSMRAERSSTIGTERLTNYALQIGSREEFVQQLTSNLPVRPGYFLQDAEINRSGAEALTNRPPLPEFTPAELQTLLIDKANIVDVRPPEQFAAGHIAGSINIALSGQFATWAGTILGLGSKPVLVAETDAQIEEAALRMSRVGIEDVHGYLSGEISAWQKAGLPLAVTAQISAEDLDKKLRAKEVQVLDVRRANEWQAGHIEQAANLALDDFPHGLPEVQDSQPLAVHCKGGYRSMIACSLLERAGHHNVLNVVGGYDAWHAAGLPEVSGQLVKA
ncbi:MAG: MBL fold metallo-hydrolase [Acidobacteria bacterium]|nr:MBL fold metallo-hydrolase [Acidobacteriota bacterium]